MAFRITGLPCDGQTAAQEQADTLDDQLARAVEHWRATSTHTDETGLARLVETTSSFTRRLAAQGLATFRDVSPAQAQGFVSARTRHGAAPAWRLPAMHGGRRCAPCSARCASWVCTLATRPWT